MLEIKGVRVFGLDRACIAAGNPMTIGEIDTLREIDKKDIKRFSTLGNAVSGSGHDNFLKGIIVQFDIKYPVYWTPEAQRYHWLEIISSQSKMHCLMLASSKEYFNSLFNKYVDEEAIERVKSYANEYNKATNDEAKYYFFMKTLSNLPLGYEMWETLTTNYLQLKTIYNQRKSHKLKEDWSVFCEMIRQLPYFNDLLIK